MSDVPHFSLPFRFATPNAAVVEQDSIDDIADCVLAILLCPLGFRTELPTFGIPDPVFTQQQPGAWQPRSDVHNAIEAWEPRATLTITTDADPIDELIARVQTRVQVRTQE